MLCRSAPLALAMDLFSGRGEGLRPGRYKLAGRCERWGLWGKGPSVWFGVPPPFVGGWPGRIKTNSVQIGTKLVIAASARVGREILSNVVYGVVAHPFGLLSGLLGLAGFEAVHKAGALDDLGQLFGPV
jgi:hypothetical protein